MEMVSGGNGEEQGVDKVSSLAIGIEEKDGVCTMYPCWPFHGPG